MCISGLRAKFTAYHYHYFHHNVKHQHQTWPMAKSFVMIVE